MRVKFQFATLTLNDVDLNIGYSNADKCIVWSVWKGIATEHTNKGSIPVSKLLTPPDIDQLAYDLYKVWAGITGPILVAEWSGQFYDPEDSILGPQYDEWSRLRVVLDWIVTSYR